ncbi:MAG: hypothetical protein LC640_13390 [Frankia sp.]|nr:hypothetical protein [Frankia sp.]
MRWRRRLVVRYDDLDLPRVAVEVARRVGVQACVVVRRSDPLVAVARGEEGGARARGLDVCRLAVEAEPAVRAHDLRVEPDAAAGRAQRHDEPVTAA